MRTRPRVAFSTVAKTNKFGSITNLDESSGFVDEFRGCESAK